MTGNPTTDGGRDGDRSTQSRRFTYDLDEDELPSEAVVRVVSALTNTSSLDLTPLYDVIDPSYLNEVFAETDDGNASTEVSFTYEGFDVDVRADEIYVRGIGDAD